MKYDHRVKVGGKWYDAGVEIEEVSAPVNIKAESKPEPKPTEEKNDEPKYSRSNIQQMNNEKLREVATEIGVEFDEDTTGKELKGKILAKLGI